MRCDNCGKEEVNFHYTSNINGNITEKHLCAECAGKLGIAGLTDFNGFPGRPAMRPEASFEEIFADLFGMRPTRRMYSGYGMMMPTFVIPTVFVPGVGVKAEPAETEAPSKITEAPSKIKIEVDNEMKKRREINILREQMRIAADAEDFEKAAAIRDSIKKLEGVDN